MKFASGGYRDAIGKRSLSTINPSKSLASFPRHDQPPFGIRSSDPLTYLVIAALLALAAFAACYVPARRALAVDPFGRPPL